MERHRPSPRTTFPEVHGAMALGVFQLVLARVKRAGARLGEDAGQTLTEYSLVLMLIALVCIGALTIIGGAVNDFLSGMASQV